LAPVLLSAWVWSSHLLYLPPPPSFWLVLLLRLAKSLVAAEAGQGALIVKDMPTGHGREGLSEPQLPGFLRQQPNNQLQNQGNLLSQDLILKQLGQELGFQHEQTALGWLVEQLEASHDLRQLILTLLCEGTTDHNPLIGRQSPTSCHAAQ